MSITRKVLVMLSFGLWFISLYGAIHFFFTGQYDLSSVASLASVCFFTLGWYGLYEYI